MGRIRPQRYILELEMEEEVGILFAISVRIHHVLGGKGTGLKNSMLVRELLLRVGPGGLSMMGIAAHCQAHPH